MSVSKDMADPDLQIRGGQTQKKIFLALWASVWSKHMGGGQVPQAPPLDPSLAHFGH